MPASTGGDRVEIPVVNIVNLTCVWSKIAS